MARITDLGFTALSIQGGLLPADFMHEIAKLEAGSQDNLTYGITRSFNLRDEIGRRFRIASDLWAEFQPLRMASGKELRRAAVDGWLAPFLIEALGLHGLEQVPSPLTIDARSFPVTHRAYGGLVPLVLTSPQFDLDKADHMFGDDGRRRTPFGLVQEYLNADERAVWGIVSNGIVLRIVRENPNFTRPAWIELDLERVFADQIYSDFAAFWLFAHGSRFAPREGGLATSCILERWRHSAQQTGERARAHLRDGVAAALVALGQGFVRHRDNGHLRDKLATRSLTADDLHQQLLRLVYCCLFLFVVEDRSQLHPADTPEETRRLWREGYSIDQLRTRALRPRLYDSYGDLWQGVQVAFLALERGAAEIGAPALGGLFVRAMCPDLFTASLTNTDLLAAIKALAFFKPDKSKSLARINYRDLNTEELGSVYESLLELHPKLGREPWDFGYIGLNGDATKGSERKLSGSYYTPSVLVDELISSALEPVIRKTATDNPYDRRAALLKLKVVDPACGSGHFLLAAARRLAREIAVMDAFPDAPTEAERQHALRDVVQHCIYGVDRNPLALELCRTALWIETVEPGRPLSFLDNHLRCGDALIGVFDPKVLEAGVPDDAYKPKLGDDKTTAKALNLKAQNKAERERPLLKLSLGDKLEALAVAFADLDAMEQDDPAAVEAKAAAFARLTQEQNLHRLKVAADQWTAAFFARLVPSKPGQSSRVPTTLDVWKALGQANGDQRQALAAAAPLAHEHRFLHWPLEFPEVFAGGGFDVVIGNPPWERIKLQEEEFFAARDPSITDAPNKAARNRLIKSLATAAPETMERRLYEQFEAAKHSAEAEALFVRASGRYPLTAVGDVNTYALFAEFFLQMVRPKGWTAFIAPPNLLTDDTTKEFFHQIFETGKLVSALSFENEEFLFPGVANVVRFSLITLKNDEFQRPAKFAFYLRRAEQISDGRRKLTLSSSDLALINPNTRTCPIFRTAHDAELTKKIYRRIPVMIEDGKGEAGNPWKITFMRMFHMTNDSHLFRTASDLIKIGGRLRGNTFVVPEGPTWKPLYEGKFVWHFDHRFGSYHNVGKVKGRGGRGLPPVSDAEHADPAFCITPRYWLQETEVEARLSSIDWRNSWLIGWRDVTSAKLERTVVASAIPRVAVGNKYILIFADCEVRRIPALLGCMTSLVFDFVARQKQGGTSLNYYLMKQFATLPPTSFSDEDLNFIGGRVLELIYTAWDMQPFARDLGYEGEPFRWDVERRALLRAELDAYYAYLYGLTRDELRYILDPKDVMGEDWPSETFRVLKEREIERAP